MPIDFRNIASTARQNRFSQNQIFDNLVIVRGRRYADVTHPDFAGGADPTGQSDVTAAFVAAFNSLTSGGTLRIPGGLYIATQQILLENNDNIKIETDGTSSLLRFRASAPLTDGLRIVNSGQLTIEGLRVQNFDGSQNITNLVTITTTSSAQKIALHDLLIDPQVSGVTNILALGPDTSLDLAEITLDHVTCGGVGSSGATLLLGNGIQGNVANVKAFGCQFALGLYGVHCNGTNIELRDCTIQSNTGSDVKVTTPGSGPLVVDGCRSENSKRFFEYTQNGGWFTPINLENIIVHAFTDPTGQVVLFNGLGIIDISNFEMYGGPVPGTFTITSPTDGTVVNAKNILSPTKNPFSNLSANVQVDWESPRRYLDGSTLPIKIIPTIAVGAAAGVGATVALDGDDQRGFITITTGTGAGVGQLATVTFGSVINTRAPSVVISPLSSSAGALPAVAFPKSQTQFGIYSPTAPSDSLVYQWEYHVEE